MLHLATDCAGHTEVAGSADRPFAPGGAPAGRSMVWGEPGADRRFHRGGKCGTSCPPVKSRWSGLRADWSSGRNGFSDADALANLSFGSGGIVRPLVE